ncbi:MAG: sodium ion-translocating decarboxylase subunit beta [Spirochaetaceae bacterium]|jgi:oxaloacetate decarboxylase beta subunit|nr:sodium ion-translocating decarboxylase subunit beta [Spirochaetaceae bacterium]
MLNQKKDPVLITKICLLIIVGAMALSLVNVAFSSRTQAQTVSSADELPSIHNLDGIIPGSAGLPTVSIRSFIRNIAETTGIYAFITDILPGITPSGFPITVFGWQEFFMVAVGFLIVYLGVAKGFEPLLLIPIGFGTIFANIPFANMGSPGIWNEQMHIFEHQGFLNVIYNAGVGNEFFPLIIFIGIGAMTDFGPLIANPKTALLGAAAQFGVFGTMFFISVANFLPGVAFNLKEACAVAIIGGADGPTTIYIAAKLAPHLLATVAVAAYSYMALVPIIQPPIMKLLTTKEERLIKMRQLRPVSQIEKIAFPLVVFVLTLLIIPSAAPLIGCLMFGNFLRECKVVDRLSDTSQNALMNIVSMFLSLGVGSQMTPEKFLNPSSLIIVVMGLIAFAIATATGVIVAKVMNLFLKEKINPLIGSAGVSAVPMAARVSNKVGLEDDPGNFLLMHAMGPNVAGVIGTAIAAGVMIAVYGS